MTGKAKKAQDRDLAIDLAVVIDRLNTSYRFVDGKVQFDEFERIKCADTLYSGLSFNSEICEAVQRDILDQGIFEAARAGPISQDSLSTALKRLESDYLARPLEDMTVCTTISLSRFTPPFIIVLNECQLQFRPGLEPNLQIVHSAVIQGVLDLVPSLPKDDYMDVQMHLKARSAACAVDRALSALDFVRGIWNFQINSKLGMGQIFGRRRPINKILQGPFTTCHIADGLPADGNVWYETEYLWSEEPYLLPQPLERLTQGFESIVKAIDGNAFHGMLKDAMRWYAHALDEYNQHSALRELWGLLEFLTNTLHQRADSTIKRASYLFEDWQYVVETLKHLRNVRNAVVHLNKEETHRALTTTHQLRIIIEQLLSLIINNPAGLQDREELDVFLELPRDITELDRRSIEASKKSGVIERTRQYRASSQKKEAL